MGSVTFSGEEVSWGVRPFFFQTINPENPEAIPTDPEFHKANSLSFIDYFEDNQSKISRYDFEIFRNPLYEAEKERLTELRNLFPELYEFFRAIFSRDDRIYFSLQGDKKYNVLSVDQNENTEEGWLDLLPQSKEDPDELQLFMKQFNINLSYTPRVDSIPWVIFPGAKPPI